MRIFVYSFVFVLDLFVQPSEGYEEKSPARITIPPLDTKAQAGFFIFLICKAQGNPKPTVQFKINGKIQKSEGHRKIIRQLDSGVVLRQQVQMDNNNDAVECTAENHLGVDAKTATITVIDSNGETPPGFPSITTGPGDVLNQIGKSVRIPCQVTADPTATVTWIKNNLEPLELEEGRIEIEGTGTLHIKSLKEQDSGNYECMARNKVGTVISQTGQLQIRNSPMTPQITDFKPVVEVSLGHGTNLTCNAEGYPPPDVWWAITTGNFSNPKSENKPLNEKKQYSSTIHITDVTESEVYICFASNNMGTVRKHVRINVKKKPPTPTFVTSHNIGSTFAVIEWLPVQANPPVDSYTLLIKDTSNEDSHLGLRQIANIFASTLTINKESGKVGFNVTDLKPFTKYEARVVAVNNNVGTSEPSSPTIFQTNELPPSTAPRDVYATAISHDSVSVKWKAPLQSNGRITGYKLYYSEKLNEPIGMWTVVRTTKTDYDLFSLIHNSTYYVKVNAYNNAGDGPVSDPFPILVVAGGIRPQPPVDISSVPPVPQNLRAAPLNGYSIQIMWSHPIMPESITLLNYVLKYRTSDQKSKVVTEVLESDKTQFLIEGLKPGTDYHISLAGKSTHGIGVSALLQVKTLDQIPDIPQGESLTVLGSTSLKISWRGPKTMLDQVKYYVIRWVSRVDRESDQAESNYQTIQVEADKKEPTRLYEEVITNLTPNLWYRVEVKAVSSQGEGKPYIYSVERTSGEVPSKPTEFRISQILRLEIEPGLVLFSIHLQWNVPERPNGKILSYRVTITLLGPVEFLQETVTRKMYRNTTSMTYITTKDDEIGYGRTYSFEVEALNEISYGYSARINETMQEAKPSAPPSKIEIQALKNTVKLSWLPPPINFRNGVIIGYKIRYFNIKNQKSSQEELPVKSQTSVKISNLAEKTNYVFMIRAVNTKGDGPWSPGSSYYISSEFSPPPENVKANPISDSQIKVTWDYPIKSNFITDLQSEIVGFILHISSNKEFSDESAITKAKVGPFMAAVIHKIYPNDYFIKIKSVIRDERAGEWSNLETVTVSKAIFPERQIRGLMCTGQTISMKVVWTIPEDSADIGSFEVRVSGFRKYRAIDDSMRTENIGTRVASVPYKPNEQYSYNYILDYLEPNTIYDVSIRINYTDSSKNDPLTKVTSCVTYMTRPKEVFHPQPIPQRKISTKVVLRLHRTDEKQGRVSYYYLMVGPIIDTHQTPSDVNISQVLLSTKEKESLASSSYLVAKFTTALFQSKRYADFLLGADEPNPNFSSKDWIYLNNPPLSKKEKYRAFLRTCIVPEGLENPLPDQLCTSSDWSAVFSTDINKEGEVVTIAIISGIGGIILLVFVCVIFACFIKRNHNKVNRPMNSNDPCLKQPLMQTGLNGSTLPPYSTVISAANSSHHGYTDSLRTNSDLCAASGVITPIANHYSMNMGVKIVDQRPLEMKKMQNTPAPDLVQNAISISNSSRPPIPVHRLESHINELKANENFVFSQEYESIDPGQQFTWENSNLEINRSKNRYANVIAYDHSRVILQPIDGIPGSDYINANYIDGYKRNNAYIATQGPLSNTFGDFWRMIWEQGTCTIVMMTKLEERTRIKCDQYWPNKGTEAYADRAISVTITDVKELAYYTIRTFIISSSYAINTSEFGFNQEKREIKQYQFTAWPDHGVPENPIPLLMFLKRVRSGNPINSGPIVVHCSAGVGRTGAFIAIDSNLERIKQEMNVDIFGQVSFMRAQRNYMVQTEDQYIFVHDVIMDAVRAGHTEVPAQNIQNHFQKLLRVECTSGTQRTTGIELEFQKLSQFKPPNSRCTSANLSVNKLKNRLVNILPFEYNRVCLQPIRGCEGSDYINASFIDGYNNLRAYIATQAPLLETVEDFWRMVWEHNSTIIVMLTKLREMGREKCHRYWPSERSSRYQYFVVDPMVEYNMPNFVLQEFKVTDARDGQSRTVRQFQFTEWPEQGVPYQAGEAFIDFIGQVHKTKEQFGQEGPITVHCSAGVGRTGVFLTLSIALDRLRNEGILDLFQTVRMLRYQRASMVQSEEQYRFCYMAIQDYVNSFENFLD